MAVSKYQLKKEQAIKDEFKNWQEKKKDGKQIYSYEYIIAELSEMFFCSERTIEAILRGEYDQRRAAQQTA